jgi:FtsP/CotA-like multicopper oxidase with cupredoxin domain
MDARLVPEPLELAANPKSPLSIHAGVADEYVRHMPPLPLTATHHRLRDPGAHTRLARSRLWADGWEPYWRDTILIQPGRTAHIAFVADNPGKWPLESAIPEHRAAGVGAWFLVG